MVGDPDALARALRNLSTTPCAPAVTTGGSRSSSGNHPTHVRATVSDDGPACPRWTTASGSSRASSALNGSSGAGTGLGLAIARAIARQHHGSVTCEDCETGARFTLELPAAATGTPQGSEATMSSNRSSAS